MCPDGITEEWYSDGNLNRVDGPAIIEWDRDGRELRMEWFLNGLRHRDDGGPAYILYSGDEPNKVTCEEYYDMGNKVAKKRPVAVRPPRDKGREPN
jgi:hypothetical protein